MRAVEWSGQVGSRRDTQLLALVWVIWPKRRQIDVWRTGDSQPSSTLGIGDMLDGLDVLPGFSCSVAELFPSL